MRQRIVNTFFKRKVEKEGSIALSFIISNMIKAEAAQKGGMLKFYNGTG